MKFRKLLWLATILIPTIILSACNLGATPAPTQDPGAVQTQAFNLVLTQAASQQTQTAAAVPPTAVPTNTFLPTATFITLGGTTVTPFAFNTQQPGFTAIASPITTPGVISTITTKNGCNDALYMGEDPHYTDATHFLEVGIGQVVEQFFRFKNTGTCPWDEGYGFIFQPEYSSPELTGNDVLLTKQKPSDYSAVGTEVRYKAIIKAPKVAGDYSAFWKLRDDGGNEFGPLVSLYIRVRKP
jgi:hypothetical protein